jgi:IS30 family transposase
VTCEIGHSESGLTYASRLRTSENTNLLLRQYFPRGTDLSGYSQAQLDHVSLRLNQRPRKTLGFETPASKLRASVASTI